MNEDEYEAFVYFITAALKDWEYRKARMIDELQIGRTVSAKQLATAESSIKVYEYVLGLLPKEK